MWPMSQIIIIVFKQVIIEVANEVFPEENRMKEMKGVKMSARKT
jgi:hypothetical protein